MTTWHNAHLTTLLGEELDSMLGTKARAFATHPSVCLDQLVPQDDFYRFLDARLDLGFVREWVEQDYAPAGRPSIDPVVFFKLQLILFFEGIRSERQLMCVVADRLSLRWYLGYDFGEPLPDHSSLTRIRERYGVALFERFFDRIVGLCQEAGLIWGQELYFDATKVRANADLDSLVPRFAWNARRQPPRPCARPAPIPPRPPPPARLAMRLPALTRQPKGLVVDGRPTKEHPWKARPLLRPKQPALT
jgi:transposase